VSKCFLNRFSVLYIFCIFRGQCGCSVPPTLCPARCPFLTRCMQSALALAPVAPAAVPTAKQHNSNLKSSCQSLFAASTKNGLNSGAIHPPSFPILSPHPLPTHLFVSLLPSHFFQSQASKVCLLCFKSLYSFSSPFTLQRCCTGSYEPSLHAPTCSFV
jgi:hypothetical protein